MVAIASLIASGTARAATCPAAAVEAETNSRDAVMAEARAHAQQKKFAEARALYLWILARNAEDDEARVGLARIDGWEGCVDLATAGYRAVLVRHPHDAEVRAGL